MSAQILISVDGAEENVENKDVEEFRNVNYYGSRNIDRRYIPTVLHWVAKEILRKCAALKCTNAEISSTTLKLKNPLHDAVTISEFPFVSIYRLSRLKNCGLDDYMAFVIINKNEASLCSLHVVKFDNHDIKSAFLKSLKTKVLDFQKHVDILHDDVQKNSLSMTPSRLTHRRGVSSGAIILSPSSTDGVFRDSVYYIGKVTISQPQAPPKFIDDVLVQLKKLHSTENHRRKHSNSNSRRKSSHEDKINELSVLTMRNRSASCNSDTRDKLKEEQLSCQQKEFATIANGVSSDDSVTLNSIQDEVQTRLVTLSISKTSLMLFSVGSKTLLLEKKIKNISFCTKGESRSDHFGFICRESGNHVCYIFQGESETKVDGIMKAMRVAFSNALQASAHLALCDNCPIQSLHKLCTKLEGVVLNEQSAVLQEFIDTLSDYDQLHVANAINEESPENEEQKVDITVEVLRKLLDDQQKVHTHALKLQNHLLPEVGERDRSRSTTIFEKAKKSLTSSFQAMKKPINGKPSNPNVLRLKSDDSVIKPRSRSYEASSSCPTTPDFASRKLEFSFGSGKDSRSGSKEEKEETISENEGAESKNTVVSPVRKEKLNRRASWRQAIYHSVVTPSRKSSTSSIATLPREFEEQVDPQQRARERWRNAIMNQILLIRMEKENKKLAANISATELRRQKLSYEDMCTYSAESASIWDELLTRRNNEKVDDHVLLEAVKGGVPRMRRGDIWQFLIKQYTIRIPERPDEQYWKQTSYRKLLTQNTTHQHAILIDLGRTFPTHAHFIPRLGSGQLSLFNILKAYSLLDREVGYCQGLSFVAGLLLMHMNEEDTYKSFCHLMFDLQIRNQYKPDMNAVQQQLYQLSRLLHDYHPTLYRHLNVHEVTPTLYAAPWFLTLYASQYPIGFVSRVMDLLLLQGLEVIFKVALVLVGNHADEILECDSFESIVEYMKSNLPEKVVNETDDICSRALNMDINQQLNLYEVEYQMLHEEMIDIRQNKERIEKQEVVHKELVNEVAQLHEELKIAKNLIKSLKYSLDENISQKKDVENERDLLRTALRRLQHETDGEEVSRILSAAKEGGTYKEEENWISNITADRTDGIIMNDNGSETVVSHTELNGTSVITNVKQLITSREDILSLSSDVSTSSENLVLKMDAADEDVRY